MCKCALSQRRARTYTTASIPLRQSLTDCERSYSCARCVCAREPVCVCVVHLHRHRQPLSKPRHVYRRTQAHSLFARGYLLFWFTDVTVDLLRSTAATLSTCVVVLALGRQGEEGGVSVGYVCCPLVGARSSVWWVVHHLTTCYVFGCLFVPRGRTQFAHVRRCPYVVCVLFMRGCVCMCGSLLSLHCVCVCVCASRPQGA